MTTYLEEEDERELLATVPKYDGRFLESLESLVKRVEAKHDHQHS